MPAAGYPTGQPAGRPAAHSTAAHRGASLHGPARVLRRASGRRTAAVAGAGAVTDRVQQPRHSRSAAPAARLRGPIPAARCRTCGRGAATGCRRRSGRLASTRPALARCGQAQPVSGGPHTTPNRPTSSRPDRAGRLAGVDAASGPVRCRQLPDRATTAGRQSSGRGRDGGPPPAGASGRSRRGRPALAWAAKQHPATVDGPPPGASPCASRGCRSDAGGGHRPPGGSRQASQPSRVRGRRADDRHRIRRGQQQPAGRYPIRPWPRPARRRGGHRTLLGVSRSPLLAISRPPRGGPPRSEGGSPGHLMGRCREGAIRSPSSAATATSSRPADSASSHQRSSGRPTTSPNAGSTASANATSAVRRRSRRPRRRGGAGGAWSAITTPSPGDARPRRG